MRRKTDELPRVTVILPVRNEASFIDRSLKAVLAQDYPADRLEIIVADGRSTDGTPEAVRSFQRQHPNLFLIDNPGRIVSTGLNAATRQARGDVIVRVDGHCEIDRDYVSRCVYHLRHEDVEGVGGATETIGDNAVANVIATAMSSPFGVGNSAFRTVKGKTMLADTIPFPAYTRAIVEQVGPYDEELVRNQDDDYNYRLRNLGAKLLLAADVRSRYYSRGSIRRLCRQYFQYGVWKVRVMQKRPKQMRPRQFVPPLFVAVLLGSLLLAPLTPVAVGVLVLAAGSYALANLAASLVTARRTRVPSSHLLPLVFATIHLAWGFGFLVGLVRFWNRWGDQKSRCSQPQIEVKTPLGTTGENA